MNESAEVRAKLSAVASTIETGLLPHRPGFVLLVRTRDEGGEARTDYVSNAGRDDVRKMLVELLMILSEAEAFGEAVFFEEAEDEVEDQEEGDADNGLQ